DAGTRGVVVAVGATGAGSEGWALCRIGGSDLRWGVSVYAVHNSGVDPWFIFADRTVQSAGGFGGSQATADLRDVGGAGARRVDQGADCAGVLFWWRDSLPADLRAVARVALAEADQRHGGVSGDCRAVAHPGGDGESGSGPPGGEPSDGWECPWLL